MAGTPEMQTYAARLASFQTPHQLTKRRASSQTGRKKHGNTIEWPHTRPAIEEVTYHQFPLFCSKRMEV